MDIRISRHARRRIKERKIVHDEIVETINNPDEITPSIKERLNYHKTVGSRHLKVTCKKDGEGMVIITVVDKQV